MSNTQKAEQIKTLKTQLGLIIKALDMPDDTPVLEVKASHGTADEIPPEVKDKLEHMKPLAVFWRANAPERSRPAPAPATSIMTRLFGTQGPESREPENGSADQMIGCDILGCDIYCAL